MNILITGATSGLGEAILKALLLTGEDHIYFTYSNSADKAKEIASLYSNVTPVHCDFTKSDSVSELLGMLGKFNIDILINNAITSISKGHFHKADLQDYLTSFKNNIIPTLQITQECIGIFRKKKFGKIINILSSYIINKPPVGLSEYTANKTYLLSMSKSWATENIRFNITSNCISPSYMITSLTGDTDERILEEMINTHPLKKILTPREVAESIVYLSKCSQQVNGINLVINAGTDII